MISRKIALGLVAAAFAATSACAQTPAPAPAAAPVPASAPAPAAAVAPAAAPAVQPAPEANPADVATPEALVKALYEVISGGVGVKRDWNRMRSLFHPTARMVSTGVAQDGKVRVSVITPEEYVTRSGPFLERIGFTESELARKIDVYGQVAHVFSTYDGRGTAEGALRVRGINSIQLLNDGKRWWVLNIAWTQESPTQPVPAQYLPAAR